MSQPPGSTAEWERMVSSMRAKAQGVDWTRVDWSKLTAKDVGVQMGPLMTREQFEEYRRRAGRPVQTVTPEELAKLGKPPRE